MKKAKKLIAMPTILRLLAAAVLCCSACTGCLTSYVVGDHPEWRKLIAKPEDHGLRGVAVRFESKDGLRLTGWWLPAERDGNGTVVLAHGQGGNRSHMLRRAALCVRNGYNALTIDLRAHGESEGNYMTQGYRESLDVLGTVDWGRANRDDQPVILFGYSSGAVAVLHAAAKSSGAAAVIADAPFILPEMMDRVTELVAEDPDASFWVKLGVGMMKWPGVMGLARLEFSLRTGVDMDPAKADARRAVERIARTPVLFLAGEKDRIALPEGVQRLYEATPTTNKAIVILPGATHRTLNDDTASQYETELVDFLNRYVQVN